MANTYHQVYIQTVFAVKYRNAVIDKRWKSQLQAVIGRLINDSKCKTLIVNGVEDHIHCFIGLRPVISISDLMQSVKGKSSKYINDHGLTKSRFEWQEGYGVFSYNHTDLDRIYKYIQNQEEHHKVVSLREEYIGLLNEFKIDFNEEYIFHPLL